MLYWLVAYKHKESDVKIKGIVVALHDGVQYVIDENPLIHNKEISSKPIHQF